MLTRNLKPGFFNKLGVIYFIVNADSASESRRGIQFRVKSRNWSQKSEFRVAEFTLFAIYRILAEFEPFFGHFWSFFVQNYAIFSGIRANF